MAHGLSMRCSIISIFVTVCLNVTCQTMDITAVQPLSFGNFTNSGGGSVIIDHSGTGSTTGTIKLAGIDHQAAEFNLTITAERTINIYYPPDQYLTRDGGTETMAVTLGPADKGNSFVAAPEPFINIINIGGTLDVGTPAANPNGNYSGEIEVEFTIVHE